MGLLRYVLANLVLASHLGYTILGINPGVAAVVVFYMLAGHVVAGLWGQWQHRPDALAYFYTDRLWRVLPQYYLAALAGVVLWWAGASSPFLAHTPSVAEWFYQIAVLPLAYYMYTGADGFVLVPPAWSLAVELQFYLLAPWLVLLPRVGLGLVMAASLAVFTAAQAQWLNPDYFGYRLLPGVLFIFLTGVALRRKVLPQAVWGLWLVLCAYLIYRVGLTANTPAIPYHREVAWGFVAGVPLLTLFTIVSHSIGSTLKAIDRTLASASYGVFLWHFAAMWVLGTVQPAHSSSPPWLLVWALSTTCALAAHYAIERPLWARWCRTKAKRAA